VKGQGRTEEYWISVNNYISMTSKLSKKKKKKKRHAGVATGRLESTRIGPGGHIAHTFGCGGKGRERAVKKLCAPVVNMLGLKKSRRG